LHRDRDSHRRGPSSSQDNPNSPCDPDIDPSSPSGSLFLQYGHDSNASKDGMLLSDDMRMGDKHEVKNSRRKMDRPRKRKRESDSDTENVVDNSIDVESDPIDQILNSRSPADEDSSSSRAAAASNHGLASSRSPDSTANAALANASRGLTTSKLKSPVPEDLSVKSSSEAGNSGELRSPTSHSMTQSNRTVCIGDSSDIADKWQMNSSSGEGYTETNVTSSVRDLEEVMNKHLPAVSSDTDPLRSSLHTDYHSQSVLNFHQKHKSTIQWIGAPSPHSATQDHLSASALLRTLYVHNRESVIRTNVYNPRPQYYGDMQATLLTPPGSTNEPYKDASHFSSVPLNPPARTPPSTYPGVMGSYPTNPISVTMSPNLTDTYSMTPPSSVSPQDKYTLPSYGDQCDTSQFRQYSLDGASHTIPIKPQAYPLPAHANAHNVMSSFDRTQYGAPAYYGATGGFGAYNHAASPTPAHYRETVKNTW
jgi:hypothetical protein